MTQADDKAAQQKIIETIRKCLALGDKTKGATEAEALTAMAMARRLMGKHNLNMSDVEFKREVEAGAKEVHYKHSRSYFDQYEKMLASLIDAMFDTQHFYSWRADVASIVFIGVGLDAQIAQESYSALLKVIRRMGAETGYNGAAKRHYMMGVIKGCEDRVRFEKVRAQQAAVKSREMIITKDQLVKAQLDKHDLRPGRTPSIQPGADEYAHGKRDSGKVNLSLRNAISKGGE